MYSHDLEYYLISAAGHWQLQSVSDPLADHLLEQLGASGEAVPESDAVPE
jgi:hypothetical protein